VARGDTRIYLAYGSNLHPRRLEARVGAVNLLGAMQLPGWALRFDKRGGDGSSKANLHPAPGSAASVGAALYALHLDQLRALDRFEGCGRGYETIDITVSLQGRQLTAFMYLAPSQWVSKALLPFDWYVELIAEGYRFHRFESTRIEALARQPVQRDDCAHRARRELEDLGLRVPNHYRM
jgi:hypothetical protein